MVTSVLGVLALTKAEVEAQLYQVGNVLGFGVSSGGCHGHDGIYDTKGDSMS